MGYQGVCYCHAQGSCIEWALHLHISSVLPQHMHLLLHLLCTMQCTCPTSCPRPASLCNCDAGASAWTYDDGQLTDRGWVPPGATRVLPALPPSQLPVTKLNFGHLGEEGQEARFQLGPLYCRSLQPASVCLNQW